MKIVKFKDGRYGVRRWSLGYEFKDFSSTYWFRLSSRYINDCKADEATARAYLASRKDKGTPI